MRKYILIFILIILAILFFTIFFAGISIGGFKLNSYKNIIQVSNQRKSLSAELSNKNNIEFEEKKTTLDSTVNKYNELKAKYDQLVSEGKISNQNLYNSMDLFDMDYLWKKIGDYATEKGVKLQIDVVKSETATAITPEYAICDLNFTIKGEYGAITDFMYNFEKDDELNFETSNFLLEENGEELQATFTVKEVSLKNNLSSVQN